MVIYVDGTGGKYLDGVQHLPSWAICVVVTVSSGFEHYLGFYTQQVCVDSQSPIFIGAAMLALQFQFHSVDITIAYASVYAKMMADALAMPKVNPNLIK